MLNSNTTTASRRIVQCSVSGMALLASSVALAGQGEFFAIPGLGPNAGANENGCYVNATSGYSAIRVSADGQVVTTTAYAPGYSGGAVLRFVTRWTEAGGLQQITPQLGSVPHPVSETS